MIYRCHETLADIAANITKCKNDIKIEDVIVSTYALDKSFNLDDYENPITYNFKEMVNIQLEENLRPSFKIHYNKTILKTEKGPFGRQEDDVSKITIFKHTNSYNTRSMANIKTNYAFLGHLAEEDGYALFHLYPDKNVKVMTRSYFTLMQLASDIGGIFEFLYIITFLMYGFYNSYKVTKHIIVNTILGKTIVLPDKYNIKKDYNNITCRKRCKCCFRKLPNDHILSDKTEVYKNCLQTLDEKMDLGNYLNTIMNFEATSHLLLKSRHRLLTPLLSLHLTTLKKKSSTEYKNSFIKNIYERTDEPVFSVEDAVIQIKKKIVASVKNEMDSIEIAMDMFF